MEVKIQVRPVHATALAAPKTVPVNLRSSSATCDDLIKQICADGAFAQACIKNPNDFQLLVHGEPMPPGAPLEHGMVINMVVKSSPAAFIPTSRWRQSYALFCKMPMGCRPPRLIDRSTAPTTHVHTSYTGKFDVDASATRSTAGSATAAGDSQPKLALAPQLELAPALQLARAPAARPAAAAEKKQQQAAPLAKAPALEPALALAPAPRVFEPRIITRKRQEQEPLYEWLSSQKIQVGVRIRAIEERGPEGEEKGWETLRVSTHDNRKTVTRGEETKKEKVNSKAIEECRCVCFHPYYGPIMDRVTVGYTHTYHVYKRQVLKVDGQPYCTEWAYHSQYTETERTRC
jgi:hypothetical protein